MYWKAITTTYFYVLLNTYPVQSSSINCLILFGDSLSDTGNLSKLTFGIFPGPRYYKGRFSNGEIWPDYITKKLNIKYLENYSIGASTTDNKLTSISKSIPSIRDSIIKYSKGIKNSCGFEKKDYLVSYFGGMNDYFNITTNPFDVISNIERDLVTLMKDFEFEQIIVTGLPPAYLAPYAILSSKEMYNLIKLRVQVHNSLLSQLIKKLSIIHPNVNLNLFDLSANFKKISNYYDKPLPDEDSSYCFHEDEDPEPCINSEDFFFYDTIHPTTQVHFAISELFSEEFNKHISQRCPISSNFKVFENFLLN